MAYALLLMLQLHCVEASRVLQRLATPLVQAQQLLKLRQAAEHLCKLSFDQSHPAVHPPLAALT